MFLFASSECSGESANLRRLAAGPLLPEYIICTKDL